MISSSQIAANEKEELLDNLGELAVYKLLYDRGLLDTVLTSKDKECGLGRLKASDLFEKVLKKIADSMGLIVEDVTPPEKPEPYYNGDRCLLLRVPQLQKYVDLKEFSSFIEKIDEYGVYKLYWEEEALINAKIYMEKHFCITFTGKDKTPHSKLEYVYAGVMFTITDSYRHLILNEVEYLLEVFDKLKKLIKDAENNRYTGGGNQWQVVAKPGTKCG